MNDHGKRDMVPHQPLRVSYFFLNKRSFILENLI